MSVCWCECECVTSLSLSLWQAQHHEELVSAWFEVVAAGYANSSYISPAVSVSTADGKRKAL